MPKLKKRAGRYDKLLGKIYGAACVKHGGHVDYPMLAAEAGMSLSTLRRRMERPETITLGELRSIARAIDVPGEELITCIVV